MTKRRFLIPVLVVGLILMLAACGPTGDAGRPASGEENQAGSNLGVQDSGPFRVMATSAISVDLSWDAVEGATGYRIETSFADSSWFAIAELGAEATSFEDFLTPSNMELNYRLTPLLGDREGKAFDLVVTTPKEVPNPFTVVAILEEPDYDSIAIDLDGFDASTFDPATFDPSTLDLSGIDPESVDLSSLEPEPVSDSQFIGPDGGILSITGLNGVTYTLTIPPGALTFSATISITPVKNIEGYPFSGGYLGAVQIQPEGIYFDIPATLSFDFPDDMQITPQTGSGLVPVAFAFERGGAEFHLTPFAPETTDTANHDPSPSGKLSSPARQGAKAQSVNVVYSMAVGSGTITVPEARSHTATYPTTSPARNAEQKATAAKMDDELAPLVSDPLTEEQQQKIKGLKEKASARSVEIQDELLMAADMNEVLDFGLADLYSFYLSGDIEHLTEEGYNDLWETAVTAIMNYLNPADCPSPQAAAIQDIVRRLREPNTPFYRELLFHFEKKYGKDGKNLLDTLAATESCKVFLLVDSTGFLRTEGIFPSTLTVVVKARIPLRWQHDGRSFLYGGGDITYYDPPVIQGRCFHIDFGDLKGTTLLINKMYPVFNANGDLEDWQIAQYAIGGQMKKLSQTCKDDDGKSIQLDGKIPPGGDIWGGLTNMSNLDGSPPLGRQDWRLQAGNDQANVLATWDKEYNHSEPGIKATTISTLTLRKSFGD